jgi:hypothetical protein
MSYPNHHNNYVLREVGIKTKGKNPIADLNLFTDFSRGNLYNLFLNKKNTIDKKIENSGG